MTKEDKDKTYKRTRLLAMIFIIIIAVCLVVDHFTSANFSSALPWFGVGLITSVLGMFTAS